VYRARQLCNEFRCTTDRYRLLPSQFVQLATFDQIHAEVAITIALANFMNGDDEWMV
jgi:hypothetical protein